MSDFFEGLAARNSGAATALRPRVASAYETRDGAEVVEEVPATMTIATAIPPSPPAPPREVRVAERVAVDAPADPAERVIVRSVVLTRTETQDAPPATVREERVDEHVARVHEHTHHEERTIERVREVLEREGHAEARPALNAVGDPAAVAATPPPPVPRQRTTDNRPLIANRQPPTVDRQPAPDPVVRITIGRVEVRAVHPPQPAPRPVPPPAAPGPSLEEFLEQRERRK